MDMVNLRSPPSMADANHGAGQGAVHDFLPLDRNQAVFRQIAGECYAIEFIDGIDGFTLKLLQIPERG